MSGHMTGRLVAAIIVVALGAMACERWSSDSREAQRAFWSQQVNRERVERFAYANARFALLHELAHFIFNEYRVPIGDDQDEEDAADRFAVRVMTPEPSPLSALAVESMNSPTASDLAWVAYWWIEQGRLRVENRVAIPWNAEHRPSEARGYQVLCLLYGSSPTRFSGLADELRLPQAGRNSCVDDAARNKARWNTLMGNYMADPAERAANRARYADMLKPVSDRPAGSLATAVAGNRSIEIPMMPFMRMFSYEPYVSPEQTILGDPTLFWDSKAFLARQQMLEAVVDDMLALSIPAGSALPRIVATGCNGEGNAKYVVWRQDEHSLQTIYICYPLVDNFAWSARNLFWAVEQAKALK